MRPLLTLALAYAAVTTAAVTPASAQGVPYTWQHAIITKVTGSAPSYTLTLDYVEMFDTDSLSDYQRAKQLGVVKTLQEFQNLSPSGVYINNINPKLRVLKTDSRTKYQLVCLDKPGGNMMVDARTFMKALSGSTVKGCWPLESTVQLMLEGTRIVQINQVYFP